MNYHQSVFSKYHTSVLLKEVLEALNIVPGELYLDTTLGGGGHTKSVLDLGGRVIATDVDRDAIDFVSRQLGAKSTRDGVWVTPDGSLKIYQKNFRALDEVSEDLPEQGFWGVLFDLGVSSYMLDTPQKGFSFSKEGPLDMRMDSSLAVTAADLINGLNEGELYELFSKLGQESYARRFARDIVQSRKSAKIETTTQLAAVVNASVKGYREGINPSTKVFMALRLAVNDELGNLKLGLEKASRMLKPGGRLVVISFHSLEDKIVKDFFKSEKELKVLTKKPIVATSDETAQNPRARSAKMRVAEKVAMTL